jgi:hypothetical protein
LSHCADKAERRLLNLERRLDHRIAALLWITIPHMTGMW